MCWFEKVSWSQSLLELAFPLLSLVLMPPGVMHSIGVSAQRMTTALNQARCWKHFHPVLCPALAGIELHKRGGHLTLELRDEGVRVQRHGLRRD